MSFQAPNSDTDPTAGFKAPEDDATAPEWSDLPKNIIPDAGNILKNNAEMGIRTAKGINDFPSDLAESVVDVFKGNSPTNTPLAEDAKTVGSGLAGAVTGIPKSVTDLGNKAAWVQHPVSNGLNAAALAAPFLGGEAAAEDAAEGAAKNIKPPAIQKTLAPVDAGVEAAPTPASSPNPSMPAKSSIGQRLAARTTAQALDINPMTLRRQAMKEGVTPEDYVLQLGSKAHELIPNLVEATDTANTKFGKVISAHDDAGAKIGQLVKSVTSGTGGSLPEGAEAVNALRAAANDYYQVDGGDLALQKTADRLERLQNEGKLDFDRLSKVKSDIGKGFNKTDSPPGTEEIYGILNDHAQKAVDRMSVQDPSLASELDHLKQVYTVTSRLIPAMARSASKEVAGGSVGGGFVSKLLPTAIGGAIGGPPGAALAAAAKYLQETVAPDLGKNISYMAMKASPKMLASVQSMFPNLSKAAAAQLAVRLSDGNAVGGMAKGGVVPHDVKQWIAARGC